MAIVGGNSPSVGGCKAAGQRASSHRDELSWNMSFLVEKKSGFEQLFVCSHGLHMGTWYTIHYPKSILCSLENDVLQSIKTWGFINFQTNPQVLATRVGYAPHQWITQGITRTTWMIFPCDRCSWPDGPAKSMISHQLKTMGSTSHDFGWLLTPITIWFIGDIW